MSADPEDRAGGAAGGSLQWAGDIGWATLGRPVGAGALLGVLVALWDLAGLAGVAVWVAVAAWWLLFPPVVPVAFGQFALVALTPADTGLVTVLPAEAVLVALLVADFLDSAAWRPDGPGGLVSTRQNLLDALAVAGGALALSALVVYGWRRSGPLVAGGLCLGIAALFAYGLRPALTD